MNTSNFARLKELFRRAAAGQELTIGFLGGSITQGSLSTQPGNAYAFRVYQWFVDTFPQSKFHYVNGGIGGTSSHYGVARAVTDVLMYQPDFVVVDFSVNDLEVPFRQETYVYGLLCRNKAGLWAKALALFLGLLACYAFGTLWFVKVYGDTKGPITLLAALSKCVFPFIVPDLAKLALALWAGKRLEKI